MRTTTLSSREFNQHVTRAKRAAEKGAVFITDRGHPAHVLLSIDDYRRLVPSHRSIVDALSMPGLPEIDLAIPRPAELPRPADFD